MDIYRLREELINAKADVNPELIEQFNKRAEKLKDAEYEKVELENPCDVKNIQNTKLGVSDFWMRAILNHPVGSTVSEKDRAILGYLRDVVLELHEEGDGFSLKFLFDSSQSYFEPNVLVKEMHMSGKGMVDRMVSTDIKWKDGCDPTKKKIKRKKKGKKINVEVK